MKEKMTAQVLVRLTPTLLSRLEKICKEGGLDKTEIARRGLVMELERLESLIPDATRSTLNKLRDAGLDFDLVVADALARKAAEDAQLKMAAIIPDTREPVTAER